MPIALELIPQDQIKTALEKIAAGIPDAIQREADIFFPPGSRFAGQNLQRAIQSFPKPDLAFEQWDHFFCGALSLEDLRRWVATQEVLSHSVASQDFIRACLEGQQTQLKSPQCLGYLVAILSEHLYPAIVTNWTISLERLGTARLDILSPLLPQIESHVTAVFNTLKREAENGTTPEERESLRGISLHIPRGQSFGVEFEGFLPTHSGIAETAEALSRFLIQQGLRVDWGGRERFLSDYTEASKRERTYREWLITSDNTVCNPFHFTAVNPFDRTFGLELVSSVLRGDGGLKELIMARDTLLASRFMTNYTCGFHVQVGLKGASLGEIKNLAVAFIRNERRLDAFVHPGRRSSQDRRDHRYAQSIANVDVEEIMKCESIEQLIDVVHLNCPIAKCDFTHVGKEPDQARVQYRGEGGVGYLAQAPEWVVLLVNFTAMARKDPNITVDQVLEKLSQQPVRRPGQRSRPRGPEPTKT